jgi:hypothetical protein
MVHKITNKPWKVEESVLGYEGKSLWSISKYYQVRHVENLRYTMKIFLVSGKVRQNCPCRNHKGVRWVEVHIHLFLTIALYGKRVRSFKPWSLYRRWWRPWYPMNKRLGGPKSRYGLLEAKIFFPPCNQITITRFASPYNATAAAVCAIIHQYWTRWLRYKPVIRLTIERRFTGHRIDYKIKCFC